MLAIRARWDVARLTCRKARAELALGLGSGIPVQDESGGSDQSNGKSKERKKDHQPAQKSFSGGGRN